MIEGSLLNRTISKVPNTCCSTTWDPIPNTTSWSFSWFFFFLTHLIFRWTGLYWIGRWVLWRCGRKWKWMLTRRCGLMRLPHLTQFVIHLWLLGASKRTAPWTGGCKWFMFAGKPWAKGRMKVRPTHLRWCMWGGHTGCCKIKENKKR